MVFVGMSDLFLERNYSGIGFWFYLLVTAGELIISCFYCRGFVDAIFGLAVVYAGLTMYDAQVCVQSLFFLCLLN